MGRKSGRADYENYRGVFKSMKLLFITHKIHEKDDDFAFTSLWVKEFIRQGFETEVICLEKGVHSGGFNVHSLGKEAGRSKLQSLARFWRLILTLKYNRVFVHMNPKWVMAGAPYWWLSRTPVYLWYTHYTQPLSLRVSGWLCRRLFAATAECLPQYEGNPKKVVTGHGIDLNFWDGAIIPREGRRPKTDLLSVHRICRSKRPHLTIGALKFLPKEYNLTIYGRVLESDYYQEIQKLIKDLELVDRVKFMGSVPMPELKKIYPQFQIMVNMAPATIDKTIVEAMYCGVEPVTTSGNAKAIGLTKSPTDDAPETIAKHILTLPASSIQELRKIVEEKHSLASLVKKMGEYIKYGK